MTDFVKKLRAKGYTARELATRWNLLPRQISRIGKAPKQMHLDALDGLPGKYEHDGKAREKLVPVYGCFVASDIYHDPYPDCVINNDKRSECSHSEGLPRKEDCEYWRVVK